MTVLIIVGCKSTDAESPYTPTHLIDIAYLNNTKHQIEIGNANLQPAFDQLIKDAEAALLEGPFSVTHKEKPAPSGDIHDYASYSRYWWPDPNQPDGLPYIRKDGETNPASQSLKESDRQRIARMGHNTEILGLAYYLTGDERYAVKAAELLRVWFLDEATRMNPNVYHAQCRPGHNDGTKSGVLDGRLVIHALEGSILIAGSDALRDAERDGLQTWAGAYFHWLTTNERALAEAASNNNHASYYDVQAIYVALYSGNREAANEIAERFMERRILSQIEPDGSMPEELARTRPLFYSIYNLHALFLVAHMAEQVDVDIWEARTADARLRAALDNLAPYADPDRPWPYHSIREVDRIELYPILQMADRVYPDGGYLELADKLPMEERLVLRSNLALPVMR